MQHAVHFFVLYPNIENMVEFAKTVIVFAKIILEPNNQIISTVTNLFIYIILYLECIRDLCNQIPTLII